MISLAVDNTRILEAEELFANRLDKLVIWAWLRGIDVDRWYARTWSAILTANTNGEAS